MIWFTSDQHYHHANIIKYCNRPFSSVTHMNEMLIKNHNDLVKKDDDVYHLGDFSLSRDAVGPILNRLNGKHYLVMGNHDHVHPAHHKEREQKKDTAYRTYYEAGFKWIDLRTEVEIDGHIVLLTHMPYTGDTHGSEDRYVKYRPKDEGKWLIHGHIHQHWLKRGKCINVGVDRNDYKPITIDRVGELMKIKGDL